MDLKTEIAGDISSVFLNLRDLAENITLDSSAMSAVVEELVPGVGYTSKSSRVGGTFTRSLYLYAATPAELPKVGKRVVLERTGKDSERWTVKELIAEMGVARIKLEAVDS